VTPRAGRPKAILIAGPTASGKSAAALELGARLGGTVINADSMQVYRELAILTARPSPAEMQLAPHRLYGMVSAGEAYSVGGFLEDAKQALAEQESIRQGDERNYARVLERLKPYQEAVEQHEKNIASIKQELANLR